MFIRLLAVDNAHRGLANATDGVLGLDGQALSCCAAPISLRKLQSGLEFVVVVFFVASTSLPFFPSTRSLRPCSQTRAAMLLYLELDECRDIV
jgi:hypothetical protein